MITFPAEYMLEDEPEERLSDSANPVGVTLREMGLSGIGQGNALRALGLDGPSSLPSRYERIN